MFLFAKLMSIKRKMQLCIFGCAEAEKFPRSLWFAGHLWITTLLACLVGTQLLRRRENKWLKSHSHPLVGTHQHRDILAASEGRHERYDSKDHAGQDVARTHPETHAHTHQHNRSKYS